MKVDEWEKERRDLRNQAVYDRLFNEIMEDLEEEETDEFDRSLAMFSLMNLEDVFNRVVEMEWDFDEETMYDVINEYMVNFKIERGPVIYDDVMPHERMLFVPKRKSAVERLREYNARREHRDQPMATTLYLTIMV